MNMTNTHAISKTAWPHQNENIKIEWSNKKARENVESKERQNVLPLQMFSLRPFLTRTDISVTPEHACITHQMRVPQH